MLASGCRVNKARSILFIFLSVLPFSSTVQAGAPGPERMQRGQQVDGGRVHGVDSRESGGRSAQSEQQGGQSTNLAGARSNAVFVEPEKVVSLRVSNRDINRVNCTGQIFDATYSQEKPVKIMSGGDHDLYVKFLVRQEGGHSTHVTDSVDLHVVCGQSVYTMILYPHAIDSVTIRLEDKPNQLKTVVGDWGNLSIEERIKRLVVAMWKNETLPGFTRRAGVVDKKEIFEDLDVERVYSMHGTGSGLLATEYSVEALRPVSMDERYFLRTEFGNVIAITVDPLVLQNAGDTARLIVVERSL